MVIRTDTVPRLMPDENDIPCHISSCDAAEKWLDALVRLVRLSDSERRAIRDELTEHLHERVHDLMLAGRLEHEAVHEALRELGDAAELAGRLKHAHRIHWRKRIMNMTAIALGIGVVGIGAMTFLPGGASENLAVFSPPEEFSPPVELKQLTVVMDAEASLGDFIAFLDDSTDVRVKARWNDLACREITHETPIGVFLDGVSALEAMDLVAEHYDREIDTVEWRYPDESSVEIGLQAAYDQRETVLVSYNLADTVGHMQRAYGWDLDASTSAIQSVIFDMVEPNHWESYGGKRGSIRMVGDRLFVKAPPRMQRGVKWILEQLNNAKQSQPHEPE